MLDVLTMCQDIDGFIVEVKQAVYAPFDVLQRSIS